MYTVQHLKHKRGRVQTGTSLYTVPIFVLIGQYNNQDSWIYTRTPGYIPGLLDVYQDSWMFNIQNSLIMHDSWLNRNYNVLYSKNSYHYVNTNKLYNK